MEGTDTDLPNSSKRIMIHHDDLIATKPSVDINFPIRSILKECEYLLKTSDASLEFQRPDIALKHYLQASIIAVEIIPRHKDYRGLQFDHPELYRLYTRLTNKIESQNSKFMEAKNIVKKNNTLHGTRSVIDKENSSSLPSKVNSSDLNLAHNASTSCSQVSAQTATGKPKIAPAVQPKPNTLQGQVLQKSSPLNNQILGNDLAARFSRLRSTEPSSPKQDPRIRTQPIPVSHVSDSNANYSSGTHQPDTIIRPTGPREMPQLPSASKKRPPLPNRSIGVEIPELPRTPDAIYTPKRGTEIAATTNLLSNILNFPYLVNGQQGVTPTSKIIPNQTKAESRQNSIVLSRKLSLPVDLAGDSNNEPFSFPNSACVTCEELVGLLAQGTQALNLLLVDLRSREDFDKGHIMCQSIICIEPITLRREISGDELADSIVIAPDIEQQLYDKRNEFDLVVVYDQSSTKMADNNKLIDFSMAVYDYGYEKKLKNPPLLLISGLDGWTDLLGSNSLLTSFSGSLIKSAHHSTKVARPLTRTHTHESFGTYFQMQKKHYSRPLTMEQETVWASTIKEELANNQSEHTDLVDELIYARTTEDFIRRYPELPAIPESMISPLPPTLYQNQLVNVVPKPPTRPAPTIPRQRSSGISEKNIIPLYTHKLQNGESKILEKQRPLGLTGLNNPRVLCYLNTVIQGLSATPWFRELIRNYIYPPSPPIPRREGESTDPPQLMVRCLSNVFAYLWFGQYQFINPTTFQGYVNAVHNQGSGGFGGARVQHDCNEFLLMLIDILDDELNPLRNLPGRRPIEEIEESIEKAATILDAAGIYWTDWTSNLGSPITQRMKGVTVRILTCDLCGRSRPVFDQFQQLLLAVPPDGTCNLNDILDANYGPKSELIEYQSLQCSKCGQKTSQKGRIYLVYMPDTLIISFMRMTNSLAKIKTRIMVPLNVNFKNNVVIDQKGSKNQDFRCIGPFIYEVYGLGLHSGNTLASGHYRMLARSLDQLAAGKPAGFWHMFDDRNVTPFNVTAVDPSEISLIFLQRQGRFL